jgi:outer membrane protein
MSKLLSGFLSTIIALSGTLVGATSATEKKAGTSSSDQASPAGDSPTGDSPTGDSPTGDSPTGGEGAPSPDAEIEAVLKSEESRQTSKPDKLQRSNYTGAEGYLKDASEDIDMLTRKVFEELPGLSEDSLEKSMSDAYKTSPTIKEKIYALRALVEKTVQAKAGWRPTINGTLSTEISKTRYSGDNLKQPAIDSGTVAKAKTDQTVNAGVEVRQNLFNGGQTVSQMREADSNYKSGKADLADTEQNALFLVSTTYMDLISKYAQIELLKRNEMNLRETLKATGDKYEVGEETRTSVAQAEAQLADGITQRITAESELEVLKGTFERATYRKPGKLSKPGLPKNMPQTLDDVIEKARQNTPTLLKAMQDEKSARYTVDRVTGALLPTIDLVGGSSLYRDRQHNRYVAASNPGTINPNTNRQVHNSVRVEMKVPLYEAGTIRSQRREAAENAEQARIRIEEARRAINERAVATWNRYKAAEKNIEEYRRQVQANLVSLDGTQQELLVGSKILLDVLNAISTLVQSQVNLVKAEYEYLKAAYEVMFVTGQLTAKSLGLKVHLYDPDIHYRETTNNF